MGDLRFSVLQKNELPAALHLFEEAFGAPKEGRLSLAENSLSRVLGLLEGERLLSMLTVFPVTLRLQKDRLPGAYLYAVATDPKREGEGLCTRLLEETHTLLKKEGCAAAVLQPSSRKNRLFYTKRGYSPCSSLAFGNYTRKEGESLEVLLCTAEEYKALRERFLPEDALLWEEDGLLFQERWLRLYGGGFFKLGGEDPLGCAALSSEGGLRIRELLLSDLSLRDAALNGLLRAAGEKTCSLSLAPGLLPKEKETPFAMWYPLTAREAPSHFYTNLLMD